MNMKNNNGFSLVELIVVIAIMAILAAVAVIGVSVYIPKAQKAADEQMIADIKTAVDLYANLESVQPGQSGYIVIHKDKGTGEVGNVTVGGTMDAFLTDALKATFGDEKYGTELKVAYGDWKSNLSEGDASSILGSVFIENIYDDDGILGTVDMLTSAMKDFYVSGGVGDAQTQANQAVLEVALSASACVDREKFIAWWANRNMKLPPDQAGAFDFSKLDVDDPLFSIKAILAARYAKGKAFVMSTGCATCESVFGTVDNNPFTPEKMAANKGAVNTLAKIETETVAHVQECTVCMAAYEKYFSETGTAKSDAEAYLATMGQINDMSSDIKNSPEFGGDGLYTSDFIKDTVQEFMSTVESYADAKEGDIVISITVDHNGILKYKLNLEE